MERIESLTSEQVEAQARVRDKWIKVGLCTEPANRPETERGVIEAYQLAGFAPPERIVWCESPLSMILAYSAFTHLHPDGDAWEKTLDLLGEAFWEIYDIESVYVSKQVEDDIKASVREPIFKAIWHPIGHSISDAISVFEGASKKSLSSGFIGPSVWASAKKSLRGLIDVADDADFDIKTTQGCHYYGQFDAPWLALIDYYSGVTCKLARVTRKLDGIFRVARNAGWWQPYEKICWISERPTALKLKNNQFHCETGPALAYPDGWKYFLLNGVKVPEWLAVTDSEKIDPLRILEVRNAQVRAEFVRKVGIERVCYSLGARSVDQRGEYELLLLNLQDGRERPYLKMHNPSVPEVWHVEGVHPDCRTVQDALNWRNGLETKTVSQHGAEWYQQGDVLLFPAGATSFRPKPTILT